MILKEEIQDLHRQLMLVSGDMNEIEKTISRVRNETEDIIEKLKKVIEHPD